MGAKRKRPDRYENETGTGRRVDEGNEKGLRTRSTRKQVGVGRAEKGKKEMR